MGYYLADENQLNTPINPVQIMPKTHYKRDFFHNFDGKKHHKIHNGILVETIRFSVMVYCNFSEGSIVDILLKNPTKNVECT